MNKLNAAIANLVMAAMLVASMPAHAAIVGTEQMVTQETRAASLAKVETFMASEQVAAQLEAWGVAPEVVSERVAALSDAELQQLAANMETDPAGGVLVLIGVIFVVLIILELVGVTNIFNRV